MMCGGLRSAGSQRAGAGRRGGQQCTSVTRNAGAATCLRKCSIRVTASLSGPPRPGPGHCSEGGSRCQCTSVSRSLTVTLRSSGVLRQLESPHPSHWAARRGLARGQRLCQSATAGPGSSWQRLEPARRRGDRGGRGSSLRLSERRARPSRWALATGPGPGRGRRGAQAPSQAASARQCIIMSGRSHGRCSSRPSGRGRRETQAEPCADVARREGPTAGQAAPAAAAGRPAGRRRSRARPAAGPRANSAKLGPAAAADAAGEQARRVSKT